MTRISRWATACLAGALACVGERIPAETDGREARSATAPAPSRIRERPERVVATALPVRETVSRRTIVPAPERDESHVGDAPVAARRLVYRVTLAAPAALGERPPTVSLPTAELFVDASATRLRARFAGQGWPVPSGAEVRLRADRAGVYVFDARGGRPLGPGQMADWFDGGTPRRPSRPALSVRLPPHAENVGPGALVCALLAEWARQDRDTLLRRCGEGAAPAAFRIGTIRGERTADVPVQLPARALRADDEEPPEPTPPETGRAFFEPSALAQLPSRRRQPVAPSAVPSEVGEGLRVRNESPTRLVVAAGGVAIGWVESNADAHFVGLAPGEHIVGAFRPLGQVVARARAVAVPGAINLGRSWESHGSAPRDAAR
ncbi:MAG: hypothetical protein RMK74_11175 [Myxococcales bacterium]|nr:hypothetical protein [Myxococcales bacterium]